MVSEEASAARSKRNVVAVEVAGRVRAQELQLCSTVDGQEAE